MIYIGVDPGAKGGYAWIWDGMVRVKPWNSTWFAQDMKMLSLCAGENAVACVERVGAMPGQGVTSMFAFGRSLGYIEGVLTAVGIGYQLVPPGTWKRAFSLIGKDKKASIECCQRLFPDVDLLPTERSRVPSDGMAESVLMAEYARRNL